MRRHPQHAGNERAEEFGPNSTDYTRPGAKYHLIIDATDIPLALRASPANIYDSLLFAATFDAIGPIRFG